MSKELQPSKEKRRNKHGFMDRISNEEKSSARRRAKKEDKLTVSLEPRHKK
jgi:large subunit ribosomal protein L34